MNRIIELSELNKLKKDMPTLLYNLNKEMLYIRFGHIFKNIWDIHTLDQRFNNPIIYINDLCQSKQTKSILETYSVFR